MHFLTASSFARPLFHGPLFWLAYPLFGFATTATGLPLRLLCLLARPPPAFFSLLAGFLCFPASAGTPLLFWLTGTPLLLWLAATTTSAFANLLRLLSLLAFLFTGGWVDDLEAPLLFFSTTPLAHNFLRTLAATFDAFFSFKPADAAK